MKTGFITGATGCVGKRLTKQLFQRKHRVIALVRKGSEHKVVAGAEIVVADPFDPNSFQSSIPKDLYLFSYPVFLILRQRKQSSSKKLIFVV